ncbi:SDR family NAD(P)-dependent oxidoreductase [Methylobacillus arboreus]|uniref:SDR family NAD(P)-dependent oxidoreductase n=1 Tax=Methylobacillus arboreus TaxID=755170 RepID=UPI001E542D25|nr:SDR family NAD(P)-dependent oxidoreductase [Methylobacillus arboreus]MCB5189935.1 SDR family NAD(P)-dependent oxidoreductase [Methylobacillus arboreus]
MKTFLGIGSGPGIGIATAERFAREGFQIILANRNAGNTQALVDQLKAKGFQAEARTVDATDAAQVAALVAEIESQYGAIDVLHYNAANLRQATISSQPNDTFVSDLAVNIGGALAAVRAVAPKMIASKNGTILLTGGGFALYPSPDYLSLSIGKAGIRTLALGIFESFKEQGVHVATVTVATFVNPGSKEAQDIGEQFWQLHSQTRDQWTVEASYPAN